MADYRCILLLGDEPLKHDYKQEITLPFPPYVGLEFELHEDDPFAYRVSSVLWSNAGAYFEVYCKFGGFNSFVPSDEGVLEENWIVDNF
jgi:hypothetical protein